MQSSHTSFAARLSLKIILFTSVIFIVTIGIISIRGVNMARHRSMDYSVQMLQSSINKLDGSLKAVEVLANNIAGGVESYTGFGFQLDTTRYFNFLAKSIEDCPYVLGAGVFYTPYAYSRKYERAGIYVKRDLQTGQTETEWDDNASAADDGWDYFAGSWYTETVESGSPRWIPPFYEFASEGHYSFVSAFVKPIWDSDGKVVAVCDVDMSLEWLHHELLAMRPYKESNVMLVDAEGNFICNPNSPHPYQSNIETDSLLAGIEVTEVGDDGWEAPVKGITTLSLKHKGKRYFCLRGQVCNGWQLILINRYADIFNNVKTIALMAFCISLLCLVVLFFFSRRIIRRESSPLAEFAKAAGQITNGRFDIPIPKLKHNDEIAGLGAALDYMQTSVTKYIEELEATTSEKERLAGELEIARKIQMQMLNTHFLAPEGCGISATSIPARQVGGDLYDFYFKGDNLFYIIADVSGKGVPAALLMSISISAFRAAIRNTHSMSEIVEIINNVFCRSNKDSMFITLNVGRINIKTGEFEVCNAGHNPIVVVSPDGTANFLHLKTNLACGVLSEFSYEQETMQLARGSRLIIYTDGVTEAENCRHEQYTDERLLEFARTHGKAAVQKDENVVAALSDSVRAFVNGAEQNDDITIMSISI